MKFVIDINGKEEVVAAKDRLKVLVNDAIASGCSDIWLKQKAGKMKGLEKILYTMLGLSNAPAGQSMYILTKRDMSFLVFLDEDYNEYRAVSTDYRGMKDQKVDFLLQFGEKSVHSQEECVPVELAFKAMLYFYENGKRPSWLKYIKT